MQVALTESRRKIWRDIGLYNLKTACELLHVATGWLHSAGVSASDIADIALSRANAISVGKRLTAQPKPNKKPIRAKMNSTRNKKVNR